MKTILAIDPSLTNTACLLGDGQFYQMRCFDSVASGKSVAARMNRYAFMVSGIKAFCAEQSIAAVYIEGYSFGSKGGAITSICEYGGLLRHLLTCLVAPEKIYEVAPLTLKKFCTGKGAGKKEMVIGHLMKRYGVEFSTNDEFDAYGLYRLGLVAEGIEEAQNQQQREAVDTVLGRGTPKRKKKAS